MKEHRHSRQYNPLSRPKRDMPDGNTSEEMEVRWAENEARLI